MWKSIDGGNSWKASTPAAGAVNALAVSPDFSADRTIFAAVAGSGLYKSADGGSSWTRANDNREIRSLAVSPSYASDGTIFFGATELGNAGAYRSQDRGNSWTRIVNGMNNILVFSLAISPNYAKDKTVFFGATATWNSGAYRSQDGGSSWVRISDGLHNAFVFSLAVSPNHANDRTLLAGTNGFLFESTNSGDSWEQVLSSTPPPVLHLVGAITSMAVSPNFSNDGVAFAGTNQEVYRRGRGWGSHKVTFGSVLSLAVSPRYATDRTLFAGSEGKGVWMSNDEGETWVATNDGLSSLKVESLAVISEPTPTIFAATAQGVYKTTARP